MTSRYLPLLLAAAALVALPAPSVAAGTDGVPLPAQCETPLSPDSVAFTLTRALRIVGTKALGSVSQQREQFIAKLDVTRTSRSVTCAWTHGAVTLAGGLRLGRGRHTATIRRLRFDLDRRRLTARIAGRTRLLATWTPADMTGRVTSTYRETVRVRVTRAARRLLTKRLHRQRLVSANLLGAFVLIGTSRLPE